MVKFFEHSLKLKKKFNKKKFNFARLNGSSPGGSKNDYKLVHLSFYVDDWFFRFFPYMSFSIAITRNAIVPAVRGFSKAGCGAVDRIEMKKCKKSSRREEKRIGLARIAGDVCVMGSQVWPSLRTVFQNVTNFEDEKVELRNRMNFRI